MLVMKIKAMLTIVGVYKAWVGKSCDAASNWAGE